MTITRPQIIEETPDYAVVFKPPKMHSVTQGAVQASGANQKKKNETLVDWALSCGFSDSSLCDSGLMHRLDYETQGLVLFAKNKPGYDFFKNLQDEGKFVKEYSAICQKNPYPLDFSLGFPPPPEIDIAAAAASVSKNRPKIIMSYFRPYGPGRKLVRPVIDADTKKEVAKDYAAGSGGAGSGGGFYRTEIISIRNSVFTVRIRRGFRHQIRCHLCWIGCPIINDPLYNFIPAVSTYEDTNTDTYLALCAHALFFTDPSKGQQREIKIEKLKAV